MTEGIGIADAIKQLREELYRAQSDGANQQFMFEIVEAELELHLEIRSEAGLKIGVAAIGLDGKLSAANTHTLRLKLDVHDKSLGERIRAEVGDRSARRFDEPDFPSGEQQS
ncbi:trypco2 family protein [Streptomyces coeruleorubidus]|uniref:trypco2 family protein n=1 Tax=Streptomyces coeruleorubidus TaxID=116188 RepID=UPI003693C496